MALFKCPECQNLISTESKSCQKCGFDVFSYMEENGNKIQCNQCWNINPPDSKVCCKCGNNLQFSNKVSQGLPKEELEQEKRDEEDRKTVSIIISIVAAVILLLLLFPNIILIL